MAQKPDHTAESKRLVFDFGAGTSTSGAPVRLIDPATEQPMLRAPVVRDFESLRQEYVADLAKRREDERRRVQTASEIVPQRYVLLPGRVLIRARPVETAWDANGMFAMTEERQELMRMHEPWGTVLMVGESFYTDYGQKMELDPRCKPGVQVMFNPAGATDLELPIPGEDETMKLLLVGFRGILMIDLGEPDAKSDADEPKDALSELKCGATTSFCKSLPCVLPVCHSEAFHRDINGARFSDMADPRIDDVKGEPV